MKREELITELTNIGNDLYDKIGTDSYEIRCRIYDVRKAIENTPMPTKESVMQMLSDASVMNGVSYEERSIPDSNFDNLADAILSLSSAAGEEEATVYDQLSDLHDKICDEMEKTTQEQIDTDAFFLGRYRAYNHVIKLIKDYPVPQHPAVKESLTGEPMAAEEDSGYIYGITADLKQYITNLLYAAYSFDHLLDFDAFVEEQMENIDGYFKSPPAEKVERFEKVEVKADDVIQFENGEMFKVMAAYDGGFYDLKALQPKFEWMPDFYPVYYSIRLEKFKIVMVAAAS